MTWKPLSFCWFLHPKTEKTTLGQIVEISSPYVQGKENWRNVVINSESGQCEIKSKTKQLFPFDNFTLDYLSGIDLKDNKVWDALEYFKKPAEYFQNLLPPKLITTKDIEGAKSILKEPKRNLLVYEPCFVYDLQKLNTILSEITYSYPITLKTIEDTYYGNCDSKQGAYYYKHDFFEDIIYRYKINAGCRKNEFKGLTECIGEPRIPLSQDRIEELRIAIVMIGENVSNEICSDLADSTPMEEVDYVDLLKETDTIVKRAIEYQ
jgi:hypothetical protein